MYSLSIFAAFVGGLALVAGRADNGGGPSADASAANTCTTTQIVSITTDVLPTIAARSSTFPLPVSVSISDISGTSTSTGSVSLPSASGPFITGLGLTLSSAGTTTVHGETDTNVGSVSVISPIFTPSGFVSTPAGLPTNATSTLSTLTSSTSTSTSTSLTSTKTSTSSATATTSTASTTTAAAATTTQPSSAAVMATGPPGKGSHLALAVVLGALLFF
ncbi:MAG: hypothetical protein L6R40_003455 [Gallowayella cf. fulva]|nr:MAG: hypothetical protein L6R40_003455 [Xanthomendoza cf. fulva]